MLLGRRVLRWLPLLLLAMSVSPALADERYFVMVFGSESSPKRARYTHTWATIVRATPSADDPTRYDLEPLTISWMPRTLRIRPLTLRGEPGINLSLQATLNDCFCKRECVAMWGPYEFDPARGPEVFERTQRQIARLNSGCVLYKCIDPDHGRRSTYLSNCIHAVTDLDRNLPRPAYNERENFGMDASQNLVRVLVSRHRFDPSVTHEWVAAAMGVGDCVQRRSFGCGPKLTSAELPPPATGESDR